MSAYCSPRSKAIALKPLTGGSFDLQLLWIMERSTSSNFCLKGKLHIIGTMDVHR